MSASTCPRGRKGRKVARRRAAAAAAQPVPVEEPTVEVAAEPAPVEATDEAPKARKRNSDKKKSEK